MNAHPYDRIRDLLDKFQEAKRDEAKACCPAHDDRNPSLSITRTDDKILLKCWAGCATGEVLDSLGWDWTDLWQETRVRYDYGNGHYVTRTPKPDGTKDFRQEGCPPVGERQLFNRDRIDAANRVVVVEGEECAKDGQALAEAAGLPFAVVTGPGGANGPQGWDLAPLKGKAITLWPDMDKPGEKWCSVLLERLRGESVDVRACGEGCHDATDHRTAGHTLVDLEELPVTHFQNPLDTTSAESADSAELSGDKGVHGADFAAESAELGRWSGWGGVITGAELTQKTYPPIEWLVRDLIPRGGITMLAGPPKSCKSYGAIALAGFVSKSAEVGTNSADPNGLSLGVSALSALSAGGAAKSPFVPERHGSVVYFTPDDPNDGRFRRRLYDVTEWDEVPPALTIITDPKPGRGVEFAKRVIHALDHWPEEDPPVQLVVVDTLQRIKARGKGADRYADDVDALADLRPIGAKYPGVTILVLHHSRKTDPTRDTDPMESVSGTQGVTGSVDQILVLQVPSDRGPARTMHVIGRDGQDHKLALSMTESGLVKVDEDPTDPARLMAGATQKVYRELREFPSGTDAAELAKRTGLSKDQVSDKLRRLVATGHAIRIEWGVYRSSEYTGDTA